MLQQTRASAVIPYYTRFLEALPDIESLARCDDELLMKLWQGLGYYSRARNLARPWRDSPYSGKEGQLPADFGALLELPGIGRYTPAPSARLPSACPCPLSTATSCASPCACCSAARTSPSPPSAVPSRKRSRHITQAVRQQVP